MQYKTITLELIRENPELYERLRSSKRLLTAMDAYATDLKDSHEAWKERLDQAHPGSDPRQISSEAMELAVKELQDRLPSASSANETEQLSQAEAMNPIRKATRPA